MSVVNYFSDNISVMYLGRMVEYAGVQEIFDYPLHPYTKALLSAVPLPEYRETKKKRIILKGEISSPINPPDECRFCKRCPEADGSCSKPEPEMKEVRPGHFVSCWHL